MINAVFENSANLNLLLCFSPKYRTTILKYFRNLQIMNLLILCLKYEIPILHCFRNPRNWGSWFFFKVWNTDIAFFKKSTNLVALTYDICQQSMHQTGVLSITAALVIGSAEWCMEWQDGHFAAPLEVAIGHCAGASSKRKPVRWL